MPSELPTPPHQGSVSHHWSWRPEWRHDRPCLYWYLTFERQGIEEAVGLDVLQAVGSTPWLDPIPPEWMHLTLCDLGFVDQVGDDVVHRAVRGVEELGPRLDLPPLTLGPLVSMDSAVVLEAGPLEQLRRLQQDVRSATEAALPSGQTVVHRHRFRPHVSLGYANRSVPGSQVRAMTDAFRGIGASLSVDGLVLAAVTRRSRHYQWSVRAAPRTGPANSPDVSAGRDT